MTQVSTGETEVVAKKSETTTEHEKTREKKERVRPPTKVVIRRLPPTLTKESFITQISPLPDHDYLYFVRPDKSLGPFAFSRAYINFIKQEDIFTFKEQFDNYTFMDKKGNEYPAVVEFAPFQRLPKKRLGRKKDPKMGTLEQDPAYVSFLESRTAKSTDAGSTQHCPLEYFPPPEKKKITTTPLLDFLRQRRAERQRMRDERREERRRKEQERKRLKDAERDRRRGTTGKPDTSSTRDSTSDSVLKSLIGDEHQVQEWSAKNQKNRDGKFEVRKNKLEFRNRKQITAYDDSRYYFNENANIEGSREKKNENMLCNTFGNITVNIQSQNSNSECKITNLTNKFLQIRNEKYFCNVVDKDKRVNTSEGSNMCLRNDDLIRNEFRADVKRIMPGLVKHYNNDHQNRLNERSVYCTSPVLEANPEQISIMKLESFISEIPRERAIKILSLDCEAMKRNDFEIKLLVRSSNQNESNENFTSCFRKIEDNKTTLENCKAVSLTYKDAACIDFKKCLEYAIGNRPLEEEIDCVNSQNGDFLVKKRLKINYKLECGKSVENMTKKNVNNYDVGKIVFPQQNSISLSQTNLCKIHRSDAKDNAEDTKLNVFQHCDTTLGYRSMQTKTKENQTCLADTQVMNTEVVSPVSLHFVKTTAAHDIWKTGRESVVKMPASLTAKCWRSKSHKTTGLQQSVTRTGNMIIDAKSDCTLPPFKLEPKLSHDQNVRGEERTSKMECVNLNQNDCVCITENTYRNTRDGNECQMPFQVGREKEKRTEREQPLPSKFSQTFNFKTSLSKISPNKTDINNNSSNSIYRNYESKPFDHNRKKCRQSSFRFQSNKVLSYQFGNSVSLGSFIPQAENRHRYENPNPANISTPVLPQTLSNSRWYNRCDKKKWHNFKTNRKEELSYRDTFHSPAYEKEHANKTFTHF